MRHPGSSQSLHRFHEEQFRQKVDAALGVVKSILDTTRNPTRAADCEEHDYDDKYGLAEFLTNTGLAATLNVLEGLGLDATKLRDLRTIAADEKCAVTLRFEAEVSCEFVREKVVDVEGKHQFVTEAEETKTKGGAAAKVTTTKTTHKVVTKVTEYHWRVGLEYAIYAYAGADPQKQAAVLQRRVSYTDVITTGNKESPLPGKTRSTPIDASLTWLLENISADGSNCDFSIDRSADSCRTPRRNEDVAGALVFFQGMKDWSEKVRETFVRDVEGKIILGMNEGSREPPSVAPEARVRLHSVTDEGVFVPVLPLFENVEEAGADAATSAGVDSEPRSPALVALSGWEKSPLLSVADVNLFLGEERRSLDEKVNKINEFFPPKDGKEMVSAAEAITVLLSLHMQSVSSHLADGVDYIEHMLETQLIKAIGKEVQASDFAEYVRFHDQKLLKDEYAPTPFSYAIRRPEHYPDGVLSIEQRNGETDDPIMAITRKYEGEVPPMYFPINAATTVEFTGDRYLHAWVSHRFSGRQEDSFQLVARARQFSSFLLLVGKISGPDGFEPSEAIILQNKDEVLVPLLLNQLPSPKDFKDAISSLSPEQKRFATAFRNMQLETSVFAVCCIQLKPQLEALLGLPPDALTKEIKLTQDLLLLFIDYQIPSDLLSFDGAANLPAPEKVTIVKGHVESVVKVIDDVKDKELEAEQKKADMAFERRQQQQQAPTPSPAFGSARGRGGGGLGARMAVSHHAAPEGAQFRAVNRPAQSRAPSKAATRMMQQAAPVMMACQSAPAPPPFHEVSNESAMLAELDDVSDAVNEQASVFKKKSIAKESTFSTPKKPGAPESRSGEEVAHPDGEPTAVDFTRIPKLLDAKFEELDSDNALCATVVKTGDAWMKKYKKNLLTKMERTVLGKGDRKTERDKAFDLLDALSRSGSLPLACAELHVIVAATHNFDHSLMQTVIQDNVNPIEKMERSTLIVASTIHEKDPEEMLKDQVQVSRVKQYSPGLFES